jgi:hypothetical protein
MNPPLAMKWRPERPGWRALCAAAAAVVLFGAAVIVLDVTWIPRWSAVDARADAPLAQPEPAVHAVQRCPHCGWIESKRKIASSIAEPESLGIYEYTLRMTDGSSRVFRETLPASWRVGERLTLIDGQDPALD